MDQPGPASSRATDRGTSALPSTNRTGPEGPRYVTHFSPPGFASVTNSSTMLSFGRFFFVP
ncbi:MAG: hypothetical protein AVDCRST_MAG02-3452 [uncultured Rubrobacteraceae bacterium]|uniref:Uncharacterized protein n=1 Tax=uncultured Rubrobacteraceae bacterium TaxID=349277 RepID=A0A6J4RAJ2_9ACTN|nr:MAG: hypothetical protein AVDCRST_MAG02-3452 [uncultured Rubrobacteraceae bacterium]